MNDDASSVDRLRRRHRGRRRRQRCRSGSAFGTAPNTSSREALMKSRPVLPTPWSKDWSIVRRICLTFLPTVAGRLEPVQRAGLVLRERALLERPERRAVGRRPRACSPCSAGGGAEEEAARRRVDPDRADVDRLRQRERRRRRVAGAGRPGSPASSGCSPPSRSRRRRRRSARSGPQPSASRTCRRWTTACARRPGSETQLRSSATSLVVVSPPRDDDASRTSTGS